MGEADSADEAERAEGPGEKAPQRSEDGRVRPARWEKRVWLVSAELGAQPTRAAAESRAPEAWALPCVPR